MQNKLKFIINLIFILLSVVTVVAQDTTKNKIKQKIPVLQSIGLEVDVSPIITIFLNKDAVYSFEGAINTSLKNKYFPVFEFGMAGADKTANNEIHFTTNGLFGRAGMDINLLKTKEGSKPKFRSYITAGLRLGYSNATYSIDNIVITDDYWNHTEIISYHQPSSNFWYEIVGSIRVEVLKNIFMGWSIRKKALFSDFETGLPYPWYIPGYGNAGSTSNWGFNYCVGYRF